MVTTVLALPRQDKTARSEKSGKVGQFSFPFRSFALSTFHFTTLSFLGCRIRLRAIKSLHLSLRSGGLRSLSFFPQAPEVCLHLEGAIKLAISWPYMDCA